MSGNNEGAAEAIPADGIHVVRTAVRDEWLDYNDHMNVAFYLKAFDDAGDRLTELAGMGAAYTRATGNSWVALESHITFQAEALAGETLEIHSRVLDVDQKKLHVFQQMFRDGELLATHEQLGLHFDTRARRSCPFEAPVLEVLCAMRDAQQSTERPSEVGRRIAIRRKD